MDNCNILLQIDGVKGSSTLADYADQIECYSWTFNVVQPSSNTKSGTERTAANPMFSDITLTKETDVSSTDLLRLCATAKEVDKVTLTMLRKANEENAPLLKVELEKVIISHYTIASAHEPHPLETRSAQRAGRACRTAGWAHPGTGMTSSFTSIVADRR